MSGHGWVKVGEETLFQNPWWEYRLFTYDVDGKPCTYHCVYEADGVMVIPVRDDGKILMVRQYRVLIDAYTIEFVAGGAEKSKSVLNAAAEELAEEGSVQAALLEEIGTFAVSPGRTNKIGHIFIAADLTPLHREGDEIQELEVLWFSAGEIDDLIERGEISDGWTISSWYLAKKRVLELIDQSEKNS